MSWSPNAPEVHRAVSNELGGTVSFLPGVLATFVIGSF
jgi:hypothetical protein